LRPLLWGLWLFLSAWVGAQPLVRKALPERARPGTQVMLEGSGFGKEREQLVVRFGEAAGKILWVTPDRMAVEVPWEAPRRCEVRVMTRGQGVDSSPIPFECLPAVRFVAGRNPLEAGQTTIGRFVVYHSQRPFTVFLSNATPERVRIVGGDSQTLRTSGGEDNAAEISLEGLGGELPFEVYFRWGKRSEEPVNWSLPWDRVDFFRD